MSAKRVRKSEPDKSLQRVAAMAVPTLSIIALLLGIMGQVGCAGLAARPGPSQPPGGGSSPVMSLTPPSISFGSVVVGSTVSQAIIVSNTGTAALTVTQAAITGPGFSMSGVSVPLTISPGQQTTATIAFSPTSAGNASGSLTITSNASSTPVTVSLSGTGVTETRLLGASPASLNFGSINVGSSGSASVTLTNNGNSNVTISSVTVTGAGFSASGVTAGTALTPSQSVALDIAFAPAAAGSVSGSVTVTSNATNSPATVALSGTGVQLGTQHSVTLSWTASSSSDVIGYYVYRGTSSDSLARLNSSPVAPTQYVDSAVTLGQTYYYAVTAVDSSDMESTDSNVVSATIPTS